MSKTAIEWCDFTHNIVIGCSPASPGCAHCYARTLAENRMRLDVWDDKAKKDRKVLSDGYWKLPLTWNRKAQREGRRFKVFCSSMADVFEDHPTVAQERIRLWQLIGQTPHLDWLLLTKRPENVMQMVPSQWTLQNPDPAGWPTQWPASVWVGTSVENQYWANRRIPALLRIGAQINFLSCEPLLGPVDLEAALEKADAPAGLCDGQLDWIIAGAESGRNARPMQLDWVRKLRDQCQIGGIPFFLKQTATNGRKESMPLLDGRQWAEFPRIAA